MIEIAISVGRRTTLYIKPFSWQRPHRFDYQMFDAVDWFFGPFTLHVYKGDLK